MILIKDRHHSGSLILKKVPCEKYDTYKGSTPGGSLPAVF